MGVLMLIALQAGATLAGPPVPAPIRLTPACPPPNADADDAVVCARRGQADQYRLKPLPPTAEGGALPRAETRVFGNAKLSGETEAANVGGFVSNRAMLRLKVGF